MIPAHHFYEWCKNKEKYTFQSPKQDATLFMAGCYQIYNGQNRFVILTTQANASVALDHTVQLFFDLFKGFIIADCCDSHSGYCRILGGSYSKTDLSRDM